MKNVVRVAMLLAVILFAVGCRNNGVEWIDGYDKRYVHNTTTKDITIVSTSLGGYIYTPYYDSVVVMPDEYFLLEEFQCVRDGDVGGPSETVLYFGQLYFYIDGVGYHVDRNDMNGCLWLPSYETFWHPNAPEGLSDMKYDHIRIFNLTEEYIRSQIPL